MMLLDWLAKNIANQKHLIKACCVLLLLPLVGCSVLKKQTPKEDTEASEKTDPVEKTNSSNQAVIGVIETVYPNNHFVLIRRTSYLSPKEGDRLLTNNKNNPVQLLVTQHKKGYFFSANIEEGTPTIGDQVTRLTKSSAEEKSEKLTIPDYEEWKSRVRPVDTQSPTTSEFDYQNTTLETPLSTAPSTETELPPPNPPPTTSLPKR